MTYSEDQLITLIKSFLDQKAEGNVCPPMLSKLDVYEFVPMDETDLLVLVIQTPGLGVGTFKVNIVPTTTKPFEQARFYVGLEKLEQLQISYRLVTYTQRMYDTWPDAVADPEGYQKAAFNFIEKSHEHYWTTFSMEQISLLKIIEQQYGTEAMGAAMRLLESGMVNIAFFNADTGETITAEDNPEEFAGLAKMLGELVNAPDPDAELRALIEQAQAERDAEMDAIDETTDPEVDDEGNPVDSIVDEPDED